MIEKELSSSPERTTRSRLRVTESEIHLVNLPKVRMHPVHKTSYPFFLFSLKPRLRPQLFIFKNQIADVCVVDGSTLLHAVNNIWTDNSGHAFDLTAGGHVVAEGNAFYNVKTPLLKVQKRVRFPSLATFNLHGFKVAKLKNLKS